MNKLILAALLMTNVVQCGLPFEALKERSRAPVITHFSWGKITVEYVGKAHVFDEYAQSKDCKLSPKGPQAWDWSEFGTHHRPGVQIQDLHSIINDCDIIIVSRGVEGVLQVKPETEAYLKNSGKEYHILLSQAAVKLYNDLVQEGKKVGMLLHSTC